MNKILHVIFIFGEKTLLSNGVPLLTIGVKNIHNIGPKEVVFLVVISQHKCNIIHHYMSPDVVFYSANSSKLYSRL